MKTSELRFIAQVEMALDTSRNVEGIAGFFDYFVNGLSFQQRETVHRWLKAKEDERKVFLKSAQAAGWGISANAPKSEG